MNPNRNTLLQTFDWAHTDLGPPEAWPEICAPRPAWYLTSPDPVALYLGASLLCSISKLIRRCQDRITLRVRALPEANVEARCGTQARCRHTFEQSSVAQIVP